MPHVKSLSPHRHSEQMTLSCISVVTRIIHHSPALLCDGTHCPSKIEVAGVELFDGLTLGVQSYPFSGNLLKGGLGGTTNTPFFLQQNLRPVHGGKIGLYASQHPL